MNPFCSRSGKTILNDLTKFSAGRSNLSLMERPASLQCQKPETRYFSQFRKRWDSRRHASVVNSFTSVALRLKGANLAPLSECLPQTKKDLPLLLPVPAKTWGNKELRTHLCRCAGEGTMMRARVCLNQR